MDKWFGKRLYSKDFVAAVSLMRCCGLPDPATYLHCQFIKCMFNELNLFADKSIDWVFPCSR